jgi:fructose/tagatose bisphosphate aldolase
LPPTGVATAAADGRAAGATDGLAAVAADDLTAGATTDALVDLLAAAASATAATTVTAAAPAAGSQHGDRKNPPKIPVHSISCRSRYVREARRIGARRRAER